MHIYIYLYYIYVVFSLLYSFVFGRPKITISNLRQKTNQQRRTSQPHRHFLEPTKIRVEESEESRAQKTENQSPCLHQKRLQKVGKPKAFRISIHHGEQSRLHWHHHPWVCEWQSHQPKNLTIFCGFFKQKTVILYDKKRLRYMETPFQCHGKSRLLLHVASRLSQPLDPAFRQGLDGDGQLTCCEFMWFQRFKKIKAFRVWGDQKNANND